MRYSAHLTFSFFNPSVSSSAFINLFPVNIISLSSCSFCSRLSLNIFYRSFTFVMIPFSWSLFFCNYLFEILNYSFSFFTSVFFFTISLLTPVKFTTASTHSHNDFAAKLMFLISFGLKLGLVLIFFLILSSTFGGMLST